MRSKTVLVALVVLGALAVTAQAEIVANNVLATPPSFSTFNGATVTGSNFSGGVYSNDAALDNTTLNTLYPAADWQTIQMGEDANNLYVYAHYYNNGSTTVNAGGGSARSSAMYIYSHTLAGPTTLVDGINANVEVTGIYYRSSSYYIGYATWNGSAWGSTTNLAWGTTAASATESGVGSSYRIDFEFAIPLSVLGAGSGVAPWIDWVADAKATVSSGGTYNFDLYPSSGFNTYGVPEPGTLALLAAGLVGMCAYAWRKRK
jgi:hypothetical protein